MTQISLSMKQTHRHREQICGCQREWGGEGWAGNLAFTDAKLLYLDQINNQDLLYNTGNYIRYPMVIHNGKEYEKYRAYIHIIESLCYTA